MSDDSDSVRVFDSLDEANQHDQGQTRVPSPHSSLETWALLQERVWGASFHDPAPEESLRNMGDTVEIDRL